MSSQNSEMFGHPKGLTLLFFTEMWERVSYYGMRAIFSLYMIQALLMNKKQASEIYGSYTGLVYLTPLIGGYVADRYWGNRKSILFGGALMAIGQLFMFFSASNFENKSTAIPLMWAGLVALMVGNGFFKPNISSMVGQLYSEGDKRKDAAFTIFYMGINLGAFIAPLVCGALGDTGNPADFKWGFLAACVGMIIGTILFWLDKDKYVVTPDGRAIGAVPNTAVLSTDATNAGMGMKQLGLGLGLFLAAGLAFRFGLGVDWIGSFIYGACVGMPLMVITDASLSKIERDRIIVIFSAAFFVIFFWACFEQAGASLTFFAEEQTNRTVGASFPAWQVHLFSAAILGVLFWAFRGLRSNFKGIDGVSGLLYLFLGGSAAWILKSNIGILTSGQSAVTIDTIPASFFQSVNAISVVLLAPVIAAIWLALQKRKSEPNSLVKQALGLIILALGYVLIAVGVKGVGFDDKISMWWLIALYVIHTIGELCLSPIGLSLVSKLSPMRLVSLLFGVWFLANAVANKAAGQLSGLYPPSGAEYAKASSNGISNETYTKLLEKGFTPSKETAAKAGEITDRFVDANKDKNDLLTMASKGKIGTLKILEKEGKQDTVCTPMLLNLTDAQAAFAATKGLQVQKADSLLMVNLAAKGIALATPNYLGEKVENADADLFIATKSTELSLPMNYPSFLGKPIKDLVQFFWIFVMLAGVAGGILFLLSFPLKKMMHGAD